MKRFSLISTKLEELNFRLYESDFLDGLDFLITLQKRFGELPAQEHLTVLTTTSKVSVDAIYCTISTF